MTGLRRFRAAIGRLHATPRRAAIATWWARHVGRAAWVALPALGLAAVLAAQVLPSLHDAQAQAAARLDAARRARPVDRAAELPLEARVVQTLPGLPQRGRDVEALVGAARGAGLQLERADYTMAPEGGAGVARLQATLPLRGSYAQVRRFLATLLNTLPHAALESLQIERPDVRGTDLRATARIVLFYRPEGV